MSLRITTGLYGGRSLKTPVTHKMRPTRDIVRQAAFNMLQSYIEFPDIVVFDLFCGSGSLGIEALSRGAKYAAFVDMFPKYVLENVEELKIPMEDFGVFRKNALNFRTDHKNSLRKGSMPPTETADLILADPPYNLDLIEKTLEKAACLGHKGTIWLFEAESTLKLGKVLAKIDGFELLKEKEYNNNRLWILRQEKAF